MREFPTIDGITLTAELGVGGMGAVYAGHDAVRGHEVAVKVLLSESPNEASLRRFEREARAMMAVRHHNLCKAFDVGALADGRPYLVMELLHGEDLGQRLERDDVLELEEALTIVCEAGAGLIAAHQAGMLHRDIKPSNIFLPADGSGVKLLDFGLAVLAGRGDETRVTITGEVVGTPAYMAPEQAYGTKTEDGRVDVYSLGAVLYRLLGGLPPHGRGSVLELLVRLVAEDPVPLSQLREGVSPQLEGVVMAALSRDRNKRPANMACFVDQVRSQGALTGALGPLVGFGGDTALDQERRLVTVLYAQGVEAQETVVVELTQAGGRVTSLPGGRVIAVFGLEGQDGDEAHRAVKAGLAIKEHAAVIGVGTGHSVGAAGTLKGEAVHSAEQATLVLESGLVVDDRTRVLVHGDFEWDGNRVRSESTAVNSSPDLNLFGREVEGSELLGRVSRAFEDEEPVGVLVHGPPGMGCSRLVADVVYQVVRRDPDVERLEARCDRGNRYRPWSLMGAVLRQVLGLSADATSAEIQRAMGQVAKQAGMTQDKAHMLSVALGVPVPSGVSDALDAARDDPQLMRDQVVAALGDLLEHQTADHPVLMVFEDVHFADTPSLELLDILLRRLDFARLAILMTGRPRTLTDRPEIFEGSDIHQLALQELSRKAAVRLARACGLTADGAEAIVAQVGGNPLLVTEISTSMSRRGVDVNVEMLGSIPVTVEAAVQARLDSLDPLDKDLAKRASVFGTHFWREGVEALGAQDARGALRRLSRSQLVRPSRDRAQGLAAFEFRSPLVRDVTYGLLIPGQQRSLHAKAGRWLASVTVGHAVDAARHFTLGGLMADALPVWRDAAVVAERDGDSQAAAALLEKALACVEGGRAELEVRLKLLELYTVLGQPDRSLVEVERMEPLRGLATAGQTAELRYWHAGTMRWKARYQESLELLEQAIPTFEAVGNPVWLARSLGALAYTRAVLGQTNASELAQRAVSYAADDPATAARAYQILSLILGIGGQAIPSYEAATKALDLCEQAGASRRALELEVTLAYTEIPVGGAALAERRLRKTLVRAQAIGSVNSAGYAWTNLAYALFRLGRLEEAVEAAEAAVALGRRTGIKPLLAAAQVYQALLLAWSKRGEEAALAGEAAFQLAAGTHQEGPCRVALAWALFVSGDREGALQHIETLGAYTGTLSGELTVLRGRARVEGTVQADAAAAFNQLLETSEAWSLDPDWKEVMQSSDPLGLELRIMSGC